MSKETTGTIGEQKISNYALRGDMSKEEFIKELTDGLLPPPSYFGKNVMLNKSGYDSINDVMKRGVNPLSTDVFELHASGEDVLILDTRSAQEFADGHIPNSIFIGLDGQFAPWVGALISDIKQAILLITEIGREEEAVKRLARVGYDNVLGYLEGGFATWSSAGNEIASVERITAAQLENEREWFSQPIIDVRKPGEFEAEHLEIAQTLPLDFINENFSSYPKDNPIVLHCAGGYRSMIAASILKSRGYHQLVDVIGGYNAIAKTTLPKSTFQCSTTKK
jgi:rhodanese-related sulfurtransferase